MQSLNFSYQQYQLEKTIQLYGDRAGGQGDFDFAGFAQIENAKVILLKGNPQSLQEPADWRRFLRLINLAQRLCKPVVLWNLPPIQNDSLQQPTSLALATAIKNTKMQLLRLPEPIISVYDETSGLDDAIHGMIWGDGVIVVKPEKGELLAALNAGRQKLKIVCEQADIPIQFLKLLKEVSVISSEELVANRLASFSHPTEVQF